MNRRGIFGLLAGAFGCVVPAVPPEQRTMIIEGNPRRVITTLLSPFPLKQGYYRFPGRVNGQYFIEHQVPQGFDRTRVTFVEKVSA
jgi:hypothetical protein